MPTRLFGAVAGITVTALVDATGVLTGEVDVQDTVSPGTYVIKITDADNSHEAECSIEVTAPLPKPTIDPIDGFVAGTECKVTGSTFDAGSYTGAVDPAHAL